MTKDARSQRQNVAAMNREFEEEVGAGLVEFGPGADDRRSLFQIGHNNPRTLAKESLKMPSSSSCGRTNKSVSCLARLEELEKM